MSDDDLNVTITWRPVSEEADWDERRCMYAYANPAELLSTRGIVYVGKADSQSVRERWNDHGRDGLLDELGEVLVLVGTIDVVDGTRLTERLLDDIEGLLIFFLDPVGNRKGPTTLRAGLVITNEGNWYGEDVMATDAVDEADFQDESLDDEDE